MPRPENITEEQIKRWSEKLTPDDEDHILGVKGREREELGYAGFWLQDQLEAVSFFDENLILGVLDSFGQICVGRDPWAVGEIVLSDAKKGVFIPPGVELADALLCGKLDEHYGKGLSLQSPEDARKFMEHLGFANMEEVLVKFNVKTKEELRELLEKQLGELDEKRKGRICR